MAKRARFAVAAVVATTLITACVGVTDRNDFHSVVDFRGGGLSTDLVTDAFSAVGAIVGVDDLEITLLSVSPGARIVVMNVRDPLRRENLDQYVYQAERGVHDPVPQQVSAADDLDAMGFLVSEVPGLQRAEHMADAAFEALGIDEPHVESMVASVVAGEVRIQMFIESPRARGAARFDVAGELVESVRS